MTSDYSESLKDVLIRKIVRAERDLQQLKMDYCRFVYGVSHRTKIRHDGGVYLLKSVDLDSMQRMDNGEWSQPSVSGVLIDDEGNEASQDIIQIAPGWMLVDE
ncbi:hypothetical protein [Hahella ganghwensis]|uniref:hypothetical protein n=1 Tax=Hahella ganghwensis TaxID=286420 RepID=UPI00037DB1AC|nr:hypothetical protein [Hahella ganghwensis]